MQDNGFGPENQTVEVNLFGPGIGVECSLIHLGDDEWLLVDATSDERDGEPLALKYLRSIGRDPSKAVRYLVATHWHDEDVHGFSKQVQECQAAEVWLTPAMGYDKLLTIAELPEAITGVTELASLLKVLMGEGSRGSPDRASQFVVENQAIHRRNLQGGDYEIWALSPSRDSILAGYAELVELLPGTVKSDWAFPRPPTNPAGIVLAVEAGGQLILLGGSQLSDEGSLSRWSRIADHWRRHGFQPSSVLKIADHGAASSDSEIIWTTLVRPDVYALMTPRFTGSQEIPTIDDVDRICGRTSQVYITSAERPERFEPFGYQVFDLDAKEVFFQRSRIVIENKLPPSGHLRLRASQTGGDWSVEVLPPAARLV